MTYRFAITDTRQYLAVRDRYAAAHPDFDSSDHALTITRVDGLVYEITGHAVRDPQAQALLDRCCCHPDKPSGHP